MRTIGVVLVVLAAAAGLEARPGEPAPAREPAAPDLLFFAERVATDLHLRCAGCHSDPETGGQGYLLVPYARVERPERDRLLRNYRATIAHLDPLDPAGSRLLRKALGDLTHGGGQIYRSAASRDYAALVDLALGATTRNLPPDAILTPRLEATAGETVALDGTLSGDRDGDALTYRWSLAERPPGSRAEIAGAGAPEATLRADRPGRYRVVLRVHDGRLWSRPEETVVVAAAAAAPEPEPEAARPEPRSLVDGRRLDARRLKLVRRLYMDLLWRSPTLAEIRRAYERPHEEFVEELLSREATWQAWYEQQLYYFLLLDVFRPKEGRLTTLPKRLAAGEVTVPRALEEIVRSQYFAARNPGNDTFVTVVLEQCLGMVVQERPGKKALEIGKKMYDGYRARLFKERGSSQADFVRIVFRQPAFSEHLLRRTWTDLHGTEIPEEVLERDAARLQADARSFPAILRGWLTAPTYVDAVERARAKPEIPYVRALFHDLLMRLPSYDELRNVRNAFLSMADPTPIRLVMGRVLLDSDEARIPASAVDPDRFVKEQFVRLLARPPNSKELETFVRALAEDPAVNPRIVIWTLVSSAEYQSY